MRKLRPTTEEVNEYNDMLAARLLKQSRIEDENRFFQDYLELMKTNPWDVYTHPADEL